MLTLEQFNVLVEAERGLLDTAQEFLHMEQDVFHQVAEELKERKYIHRDTGKITPEGCKKLEPYRVKRAIFMAAGFGSRMVPLTYSLPKPLIMVHGKRIIETLLEAVLEAGIDKIYIVRGYQGEAFDMLKKKYPMIQFLENPDYNKANNISSAYVMRDLMQNALVLESDLVLYNKRVIRKYEYTTNYLGKKVKRTEDWCFKTKDGYVTELLVGGEEVSHMYGISYWNAEDGCKMSQDIPRVYRSEGGAKKYWDEISMRDCKDRYKIMVKPVYEGDVIEIDTFQELQNIDSRYEVL